VVEVAVVAKCGDVVVLEVEVVLNILQMYH
jgi:hypothetical protein